MNQILFLTDIIEEAYLKAKQLFHTILSLIISKVNFNFKKVISEKKLRQKLLKCSVSNVN